MTSRHFYFTKMIKLNGICYLPGCGALEPWCWYCRLLALEPERVSSEPNQFECLLGPVDLLWHTSSQLDWVDPSQGLGRRLRWWRIHLQRWLKEERSRALLPCQQPETLKVFIQLRLNFSCQYKEERRFVREIPQSFQRKLLLTGSAFL